MVWTSANGPKCPVSPEDRDEIAEPRATDWQTIDSAPEHEVVRTKIHDKDGERNYALLRRRGNLWWFYDNSMYIYYTPTHWASVVSRPDRDSP